ncbi:MAG: hypothetical protein EKK48_11330 [Candidatus Melainabacteria bacterium]|nr:MAG: hypothetical protein EKK48_11330 [Candidatus Melainabacteria bacterium]
MADRIGTLDVTLAAAQELPNASAQFVKEAYEHPVDTAIVAGKTLATSALMGSALGYIIPARGPAGMIIGAAFTIPMVVGAVNRVRAAEDEANSPAGSLNAAAKGLAKSTVAGTVDLGLNLAGGFAGASFGHKVATSDTVFGDFAQKSQRFILKGENEGMIAADSWINSMKGKFSRSESAPVTETPGGGIALDVNAVKAKSRGILNPNLDANTATATAESLTGKIEPKTALGRRLQQYGIANESVERSLTGAPDDLTMYYGSLHGHSRYSDGMGLPKQLYERAQQEGQQVTTITDHNHAAARGGVGADDPRTADQAGTPVVAENPIEYSQTFADAAATTNEKHVSLVGVEMGTIGKVGGGHSHGGGGIEAGLEAGEHHTHGMAGAEAIGETNPGGTFNLAEARAESNAAAHIGGVNHINLFEVPQFFLSQKQQPGLLDGFMSRLTGRPPEPVVKAPDVIKYNDGDYKAMVDHLDKLKDTTGNTPVIQLNHPRYLADENPNTPAAQRGRDYGQKSFKNHDEWLRRFADPYVRQIELIKGGALNPNPVDKVPTGNLDPTSFAGYLDKGVHASPTFGRDFHFGDPVGNPGATGIYARGLTKVDILDALRERRTIATTSSEKLSGVLTANDKFVMGSILDQSAVDSLALKMKIDGKIEPDAQYSVKLWGDKKIGDGKLAEVVQEQTMTGSQLLSNNQVVAFDPVTNKVGQGSAYYVEVGRTDPKTANLDRMWTAPIWVEPLAGAQHSLATRWMAGIGAGTFGTGF